MSVPPVDIEDEYDDIPDEDGELLLPAKVFEFTASRKAHGTRLDAHIVIQLPDLSRSQIQKSIEAGKVTVNGAAAKASYRVRPGDHIYIESPEPPHPAPLNVASATPRLYWVIAQSSGAHSRVYTLSARPSGGATSFTQQFIYA